MQPLFFAVVALNPSLLVGRHVTSLRCKYAACDREISSSIGLDSVISEKVPPGKMSTAGVKWQIFFAHSNDRLNLVQS